MALNSKQEKLLDTVADNADDIEADVEDKAEEAATIMHQVMTDPSKQDAELFEALGVPPGTTIQGLSTVPVVDRGIEWQDDMTGLVAAAKLTAWVHTQGVDALVNAEKHGANMVRLEKPLNRSEAAQAGKAGVRKDKRIAAKERRDNRRT